MKITVEIDEDVFGELVRDSLREQYVSMRGHVDTKMQKAFLKVIKYYSVLDEHEEWLEGIK
jgi:hypothetical protein